MIPSIHHLSHPIRVQVHIAKRQSVLGSREVPFLGVLSRLSEMSSLVLRRLQSLHVRVAKVARVDVGFRRTCCEKSRVKGMTLFHYQLGFIISDSARIKFKQIQHKSE